MKPFELQSDRHLTTEIETAPALRRVDGKIWNDGKNLSEQESGSPASHFAAVPSANPIFLSRPEVFRFDSINAPTLSARMDSANKCPWANPQPANASSRRCGIIMAFHEKNSNAPTMPGDPHRVYASMGNYIFSTPTLLELLTADAKTPGSHHDFGK